MGWLPWKVSRRQGRFWPPPDRATTSNARMSRNQPPSGDPPDGDGPSFADRLWAGTPPSRETPQVPKEAALPPDPAVEAPGGYSSPNEPYRAARSSFARHRPPTKFLVVAALVLVVGFGIFILGVTVRAAQAGRRGEQALLRAEQELEAQQVSPAEANLAGASLQFHRMQSDIHALGPLLGATGHVPILGDEVRAVQSLATIGAQLSEAGSTVASSAGRIVTLEGDPQTSSPAQAVTVLQAADRTLRAGLGTLASASSEAKALSHDHLIGPVASARAKLEQALPRAQSKATATERGLSAALTFAGVSGPKTYLVLSQNPDELRPTGGYIGTYGVISANNGTFHLDRYDSVESWTEPRPTDVVPPSEVSSVFAIDPRLSQTLADVNDTPDWSAAAQLAVQLWQAGGEQPVDGVVSFTPALLAGILTVVGPVNVPEYGQTVTAANALPLIDYYAHTLASQLGSHRKDFIAALAEALLPKLLAAPASEWKPLGKALSTSLEAREAMAWSADASVQSEINRLHWAGDMPATKGDFFQDAEFEYAAKNGSTLTRAYADQVSLHPDGSADITTTMTISNTATAATDPNGDLSLVTFYGPAHAEAVIPPTSSIVTDRSISGHPAQAAFVSLGPGQSATVAVSWHVPRLAQRLSDGSWRYTLNWIGIAGHRGDTLHLSVSLPRGATWAAGKPPTEIALSGHLSGSWRYRARP